MTGNPLRWADPEPAAARYDPRDLAPQLSGPLFCGPVPDQQQCVLLDWSEPLVPQDCSAAFGLDPLHGVLPALVRAFVASHTYAKAERWDSGRDVVELYDVGCGSVVDRVLPLTGLIAVALHGDDCRGPVEASRAELAGTLARIHELMIGR
jgi:hypothetical protein